VFTARYGLNLFVELILIFVLEMSMLEIWSFEHIQQEIWLSVPHGILQCHRFRRVKLLFGDVGGKEFLRVLQFFWMMQ
jgi:hypothetical protein